jgi:hypothetical protein
MTNQPTAHFVSYPYRIEDLRKPHLAAQEDPFVIEKTVELKKMDFENFISDLCVDRWFIEENTKLCHIDENGIRHCILIRQVGKTDGILVMSDGTVFAKYAAYFMA